MMFINRVTFWNDLTNEEDREVNVVYGETFQDALYVALDYYGEDYVSSISLESIGDEANNRLIQINDDISKVIMGENI